jgi:hypothetical protein
MCSLEKEARTFPGQKFANSLYFSLFAGNSGGEGLARDCALRHTVWVAEKSGCITARIAENRRNSGGLAFKPHRRKCAVEPRGQVFWRFSLEGTRAVRFQRLHRAKAVRSQTDDVAKATGLSHLEHRLDADGPLNLGFETVSVILAPETGAGQWLGIMPSALVRNGARGPTRDSRFLRQTSFEAQPIQRRCAARPWL